MKIFFLCILSFTILADITAPLLPNAGIVSRNTDSFYDPEVNYAKFLARVSDKNRSTNILKLKYENGNLKFLKIGDSVNFRVKGQGYRECEGHIRDVEPPYLTMFVDDIEDCWKKNSYFRRGTILVFDSKLLSKRVYEGSVFRKILLRKREDYLRQLEGVNNFLWSYDQEKIKVAAKYDERINALEQKKRKGLEGMINKKNENIYIQSSLMKKLNEIDSRLEKYRVERKELFFDRWSQDRDLDLPMQVRPQRVYRKPDQKKRWHTQGVR